jgi:flagellar hook-basal body complex protein FliE
MPNLSVENLNRIVQTGDTEALFGAGGAASPARASDAQVARVMEQEGMSAGAAPGPEGAHSFSDLMRQSVAQVNEYQHEADRAINELVAGRSKNIHETMLTIERADTSLKLMTQVRNKILDAYREIMRMQV